MCELYAGRSRPARRELPASEDLGDVPRAGATGYLGLELHNFHVLTNGPERSRLVDVFTFFPGGDGYSYWADISADPVDADAQIYRAWWL